MTSDRRPLVLVVEDEALLREMIALEFEISGFDVIEAETAEAALTRLRDVRKLDLLFTDIRLPGMDGWWLATEVRARHAETPVIYASGNPETGQRLPRSEFLQKPYRPDQIFAAAAGLGVVLPDSAPDR
jgi:CheY-like chemotaxis protein